ncbi:glutathione S-transferase family protein [filamentous cyanobacterium LEGE 11480]|uniref:Glutathione S-transferase family protein n=1 Tax=Romeriopsis navalis LEGE 11480 TaxID=2777977 RepID=A0A928VUP2_9CYAN|nr:glutathione S-transferase family protein [Romeriopsis navalis]MBE9033401.1 glutathione S-transferase family protein [Romeriopsis navalis LEGE 11480]
MYRVYGDVQSGNCYKIKLLMSHLGLADEWIDIDLLKGETETEEFLDKNPNGKIPLLELPSGQCLSESNAILNYLAVGSSYLPEEAWTRAKVLQWQFFEQYSHEPYIAVARFIAKYLELPESRRAEFEAKQKGGYKALSVMEKQLGETQYLAGAEMTIADISLYAYTHVAHEGGFDLVDYPAVRRWLDRVASHPHHVTIAQLVSG